MRLTTTSQGSNGQGEPPSWEKEFVVLHYADYDRGYRFWCVFAGCSDFCTVNLFRDQQNCVSVRVFD